MDTHGRTPGTRGAVTAPGGTGERGDARGRDGGQGPARAVPPSTVARLPGYLRALHALAAEGAVLTSSDELAARSGVTSAQLRKDLSFLGSYGRRGVGRGRERARSRCPPSIRQ